MKVLVTLIALFLLLITACTLPETVAVDPPKNFVLENNPCVDSEDIDNCYMDLVTEQDIFACPLIGNVGLRDLCYINALSFDAQEKYCEATSDTLRDNCYAELGLVHENYSFCEKILDDTTKSLCETQIAQAITDIDKCGTINSTIWRDNCFNHFGRLTNDKTLCFSIQGNLLQRDACIFSVATLTSNTALCDSILSTTRRAEFGEERHTTEECITRIAIDDNSLEHCDTITKGQDLIDYCKYIVMREHDMYTCDDIQSSVVKEQCKNKRDNVVPEKGRTPILVEDVIVQQS